MQQVQSFPTRLCISGHVQGEQYIRVSTEQSTEDVNVHPLTIKENLLMFEQGKQYFVVFY